MIAADPLDHDVAQRRPPGQVVLTSPNLSMTPRPPRPATRRSLTLFGNR